MFDTVIGINRLHIINFNFLMEKQFGIIPSMHYLINYLIIKCKGKVRPRTDHEGPEGD